jgi:NTE family protein
MERTPFVTAPRGRAPQPRRIAIACQGGGSHTAFTAGVLKPLLRHELRDGYKICALSGTSGGAICAALAWYGLIKVAEGSWDREQAVGLLEGFWHDNSAQSLWEQAWNDWTLSLVRLNAQGRLPNLKSSPYSAQMEFMNEVLRQFAPREEFVDLRMLLEKYFKIDEITQPVLEPRLLIGAVAVLAGTFKAFDSLASEISVDAVLASTTLPTLFKAIRIGDDVYWDGLFSQNPPVRQLVVGIDIDQKPDEIWIIRINRQRMPEEPTSVEEIEDRRNALAGNLSLNHEVDVITRLSEWLREGKLTAEHVKPIDVRWIEMSPNLNVRLGYVTKLNRDPGFLASLIADGEAQGEAFLREWKPSQG